MVLRGIAFAWVFLLAAPVFGRDLDPICAVTIAEGQTQLSWLARDIEPLLLGPANEWQRHLAKLEIPHTNFRVPEGKALTASTAAGAFSHLAPAEAVKIIERAELLKAKVILVTEGPPRVGFSKVGELFLAVKADMHLDEVEHEFDHLLACHELAAKVEGRSDEERWVEVLAILSTPLGALYVESRAVAISMRHELLHHPIIDAQTIIEETNYPFATGISHAMALLDFASRIEEVDEPTIQFKTGVIRRLQYDLQLIMDKMIIFSYGSRARVASLYRAEVKKFPAALLAEQKARDTELEVNYTAFSVEEAVAAWPVPLRYDYLADDYSNELSSFADLFGSQMSSQAAAPYREAIEDLFEARHEALKLDYTIVVR